MTATRDSLLRPVMFALIVAAAAALGLATAAIFRGWVAMWVVCAALLGGLKLLTLIDWPTASGKWRDVAAYLFGWIGLDPVQFTRDRRSPRDRARSSFAADALWAMLGAALIWGVARWIMPWSALAAAAFGWTGMIMLAHFGALALLARAWRLSGRNVLPLMDRPLRSQSIGEFWGRRWNRAFRDVADKFVFRPLARRWSPAAAALATFVASGLAHEAAISAPARGGFGGPTLYFLLQWAALSVERSRFGQRLGLGRGARGRLFTALVIVLPLPLLFHAPFLRRVILPLMEALGAI